MNECMKDHRAEGVGSFVHYQEGEGLCYHPADENDFAQIITEEALTQLKADSAVLLLAIERGYLSNDEAAALQLDIR
jgi:hypothetical protein